MNLSFIMNSASGTGTSSSAPYQEDGHRKLSFALRARFCPAIAEPNLALAGEVDGLAQNPGGLLRRMKPVEFSASMKSEIELRLALKLSGGSQLCIALSGRAALMSLIKAISASIARFRSLKCVLE